MGRRQPVFTIPPASRASRSAKPARLTLGWPDFNAQQLNSRRNGCNRWRFVTDLDLKGSNVHIDADIRRMLDERQRGEANSVCVFGREFILFVLLVCKRILAK